MKPSDGPAAALASADLELVVVALRDLGVGSDSGTAAEYGYPNLPLCLVDAVFSLREPYSQVRCTVVRFGRYWDANFGPPRAKSPELRLSTFTRVAEIIPAEQLARDMFQDAHKAPGCRGLLKAAVVVDLAQRLCGAGIETREDVLMDEHQTALHKAVTNTKGIGPVGLRYLRMLCGDEHEAKPDVWIHRFLEEDVLTRSVSEDEAVGLLRAATEIIRADVPWLTLRAVDHAVWLHKSGNRQVDC
jgi:hypothetical protein